MAKSRTFLHLALALTLLSLTCDFGAVCAFAGMEGECCCPMMMESGGSPCTEMSGDGEAPGAPEPEAAIESGERFAAAVLAVALLPTGPDSLSSPQGAAPAGAPLAAPTPLYLSHCAFLC